MKKILLVEDDKTIVTNLTEFLNMNVDYIQVMEKRLVVNRIKL